MISLTRRNTRSAREARFTQQEEGHEQGHGEVHGEGHEDTGATLGRSPTSLTHRPLHSRPLRFTQQEEVYEEGHEKVHGEVHGEATRRSTGAPKAHTGHQ